jgi:hypothetical protein
MQTFVVEVLNEKAVSLLRDLEDLDIIRLIPQEPEPDEKTEKTVQNRLPGDSLNSFVDLSHLK